MKSATTTLRNLAYSSANVYAEYILGLLVSIIVARSLGPEEFGVYAFVVWLVAFGVIMVNAGVSIGAIKFFADLLGRKRNDEIGALHSHLSRIQVLRAVIFVAGFSLIVVFAPDLLVLPSYSSVLWFVGPAVFLRSYYMYQVGVIKGLQDFGYLAKIAFIVSPLNLIMVLIVFYLVPSVEGFLTVFLIASILFWLASSSARRDAIASVHQAAAVPVELKADLRQRISKHLRIVSLIVFFSFLIFGQSELMFLKHFSIPSDIAFFSVGYTLAAAATAMVPGVYDNLLLSKISFSVADSETSEGDAVITSARHMLLLGSLISIPIIIYADDVILLFYGESYLPAARVLQVMTFLSIFKGIRDTTNAYLMSADRQLSILKILTIAGASTIALDYYLISNYGLWGAVLAYAAVDLAVTLVVSIYTFSILQQWPGAWKMAKTVLAGLLAAAVTIGFDHFISFKFSFLVGGTICLMVFLSLLFALDSLEREDYLGLQQLLGKFDSPVANFTRRMVDRGLIRNPHYR